MMLSGIRAKISLSIVCTYTDIHVILILSPQHILSYCYISSFSSQLAFGSCWETYPGA